MRSAEESGDCRSNSANTLPSGSIATNPKREKDVVGLVAEGLICAIGLHDLEAKLDGHPWFLARLP